MQQIVSRGQAQLHCQRFCLTLSPLPRILVPPYTIRDIRVCGDITLMPDMDYCDCSQRLNASIPLSAFICDERGNTHTALAHITVPVTMHESRVAAACRYLSQAEVQLCQRPVCFDDPAEVSVCLTVCLQVYGVRLAAMLSPAPCPICPPPLPLYPQPCQR